MNNYHHLYIYNRNNLFQQVSFHKLKEIIHTIYRFYHRFAFESNITH